MMPLTEPTTPSANRLNVIFRGGNWLRGFFVLSFGATTAVVLMMATFKVLQQEPTEAFGLLKSWGPSFLIGILALYLLSSLIERAVDKGMQIVREYFATTAMSQDKSIAAQEKTAVALQALATGVQQIANKDDRAFQEMQTLTAYTGAQSEKIYRRMGELHDKFDEVLIEARKKL